MLGSDGPQVLEVNAIPGLTDTSLFPMAAEAAGISFEELVGRSLIGAAGSAIRRAWRPSLVLEILGRDVVEELLELVDDLLGVLGGLAVLELDRRLLDHLVGREDRSDVRTARASASEGRESISSSEPFMEIVIDA